MSDGNGQLGKVVDRLEALNGWDGELVGCIHGDASCDVGYHIHQVLWEVAGCIVWLCMLDIESSCTMWLLKKTVTVADIKVTT